MVLYVLYLPSVLVSVYSTDSDIFLCTLSAAYVNFKVTDFRDILLLSWPVSIQTLLSFYVLSLSWNSHGKQSWKNVTAIIVSYGTTTLHRAFSNTLRLGHYHCRDSQSLSTQSYVTEYN